MFQAKYPIILASGSPRRQQFLRDLGLDFEVRTSLAEEAAVKALEVPEVYAKRLARVKASVGDCGGKLVIAADTIVVLAADGLGADGLGTDGLGADRLGADGLGTDGLGAVQPLILGKPRDEVEALHMLQLLAGRVHTVITAVCLILPQGQEVNFYQSSKVQFHNWTTEILAAYASTKEPLDKAGGYAIQGQGSFLVAAIEGSWSNVVGLPMAELVARLLAHDLLIPVYD